jgi:hypothetical protein
MQTADVSGLIGAWDQYELIDGDRRADEIGVGFDQTRPLRVMSARQA